MKATDFVGLAALAEPRWLSAVAFPASLTWPDSSRSPAALPHVVVMFLISCNASLRYS